MGPAVYVKILRPGFHIKSPKSRAAGEKQKKKIFPQKNQSKCQNKTKQNKKTLRNHSTSLGE